MYGITKKIVLDILCTETSLGKHSLMEISGTSEFAALKPKPLNFIRLKMT